MKIGNAQAIKLIAGREFSVQVRKKSFVISNAIILLVIIGGIVAASIFGGNSDGDADKVGLVGNQALASSLTSAGNAIGNPVDVMAVTDEQTARDQVAAGDLAVALVPQSGGAYTAVTEADPSTNLKAVLDNAVAAQAQSVALRAQGVDQGRLQAAVSGATVTVDAINPPDPAKGQRVALSFAAVILLYMQILLFGIAVAMGVVEEKSSRVVEVLLSTVRPLQLLWGKVIGIGTVGLMQLAAYGVVGLGAGMATGLLTITGTAVAVFVSTLAWFVLGFAFFAVLYAAGGSLVSRQEDVNSVTMPIMVLIIAMFYAAFSSVSNPSGAVSNVLSWIPPFSAILMPLRIAAGVASPVQIAGTVLLMIATTGLLSVFAAKIYQRSILRIGKSVSWREALTSAS